MSASPNISYTLRRRRFSRSIRFSVYADGRLVVTAPILVGRGVIEGMIEDKREWILEKMKYAGEGERKVSPEERKAEYKKYKCEALKLAEERLAFFNQMYGLQWKNVRIKLSRTRWGSCSGKGNLNFNYKIALLPAELADYIVVHELCHLAQMNHSPKFWLLVAQTIPDYSVRRRAIRKHEIQLS